MKRERFTRGERGFAKRAANRMLTNEHRDFESDSRPGVFYHARIMIDGKVMCDCQGWTIKKRNQPRICKHTRELINGRAIMDDGEFFYLSAYAAQFAASQESQEQQGGIMDALAGLKR